MVWEGCVESSVREVVWEGCVESSVREVVWEGCVESSMRERWFVGSSMRGSVSYLTVVHLFVMPRPPSILLIQYLHATEVISLHCGRT